MPLSEKRALSLLRLAAACVMNTYVALIYFLSFLGPCLLIARFRFVPIPILLILCILGYGLAGAIFLTLLVCTKRFCIGHFEPGLTSVQTANGRNYCLASLLMITLEHSPFKSMAVGISLMCTWFYRGMGAQMPASTVVGIKTLIFDPWFLTMGENVNVGAGATILGHLGEGRDIFLGPVIIGDGAIIGVNSLIFPNVTIGKNARVGAGAVVVKNSKIGDGETWVGIPAKKLETQ